MCKATGAKVAVDKQKNKKAEFVDDGRTVVSTEDLPPVGFFGLGGMGKFYKAKKQKPEDGEMEEPLKFTWAEKWAMYKAAVSIIVVPMLIMLFVFTVLIFGTLYLWGAWGAY